MFLFAKNSTICNHAADNAQFQLTFVHSCHFTTLGNRNNPCPFACDDIIIKNSLPEKILGLTIDNNLDFSHYISNTYVKLQIKNRMLYSEHQLVWTQINVACWLILLLNFTSVIVRLFGCSVIEKSWRK